MRLPTLREREVLFAFADYRHAHGISATFGEIAQALGVTRTTVCQHVDQLCAKGYLRRSRKHISRSVEIVHDPRDKDRRRLAVLGEIGAGGIMWRI